MPRRGVVVIVLAEIAVVAATGFWRLGERSLWDDEVHSLEFARESPGAIWHDRDPNLSPFYYEMLHAWRAAFGEGEAALRALSACGRVLGLFAILALAAVTLGWHHAPIAGWLYALSPAALLYGREARPYPLALAFSCAGLACLWRGEGSRRVRWAVAAGVALAAALMMHYSTLFLLGGLIVAHLLPSLRPRRWALGVALGVVALSVIPWAGVFVENLSNLAHAATGIEQVPIPFGPPGKAAYALYVMVLGETEYPWRWRVTAIAAVASALLCVLGWRALATRRELRAFLVVPLMFSVIALSLTMKAGPRYVFVLLPCLFVLFTAGAMLLPPITLRSFLVRCAAMCFVSCLQLGSTMSLFEGRRYHNMAMVEPTREVAGFVRSKLRPDDLVVYTSSSVGPMLHYLGTPREPRYLDPKGEAKVNRDAGEETFEEFLSAAEGRTVWWIERSRGFVPEAGAIAGRAAELRALLARHRGSTEWRFGHDPDVADKRRWIKKEFLEDRIVVVRFDP